MLEPVLHGRSVAIHVNGFVEQIRPVAESETGKTTTVQHGRDTACNRQQTDSPQCSCSSSTCTCTCTGDSKLSPVGTSTCTAAITVESSPSSCCISTTMSHPPIATSATQQPSVSSPVSVACSGTKELIPAGPGSTSTYMLEMKCTSEQSVQSSFSPQLDAHVHVQQEESAASSPASNLLPKNQVDQPRVQSPLMSISSTDSSPASSTMSAKPQQEEVTANPEQFLNSISDFGAPLESYLPYNSAITAGFSQPPATMSCSAHAEIDPMLHAMSGSDSIPSVATSVPFHNPNFIPQAPLLSDFNPRIPSSFDFSNNDSTCQSFDNSYNLPFTDNSISAVSMPTTGAHASNFNISNISDNSLTQQLIIGEDSLTDETSLDALTTSLPHPAASIDPMMVPFAHSYPQTNLASDSNFTPSLQDPMFCGSTHLNADLASQEVVDSPNSSFHNPISCSSNAEVQDILQQFM